MTDTSKTELAIYHADTPTSKANRVSSVAMRIGTMTRLKLPRAAVVFVDAKPENDHPETIAITFLLTVLVSMIGLKS